jgi:hypothetical protein
MKRVESAKAKGNRQNAENVVIFFDAGKVLRRPEWLVPRSFALPILHVVGDDAGEVSRISFGPVGGQTPCS